MSKENRRKFLRVSFDSNFEVSTNAWSDPEARGLDISLSGCRFHCEQSLSEDETVSVTFNSDLVLKGTVKWCWPIEWYYLAAVHFENISETEKNQLRNYIKDVTGEDYNMEKEEESNDNEIDDDLTEEEVDIDFEEIDDLDDLSFDVVNEDQDENESSESEISDDLENLTPLDEKDLIDADSEEPLINAVSFSETSDQDDFLHNFADGDLNPLSFKGKQVIIFDMVEEQTELLSSYLRDRIGMEVDCVSKKQNLWRHLKIDPMDLVILEAGSVSSSDALEVMQQTKDQFPEANYICISGPVSLERRIQFLNAGALDYLTRPIHLSTIAQSILVHLSRMDYYKKEEEYDDPKNAEKITTLERPFQNSADTFHDEDLTRTLDLLDEDLNVSQEVELIDEEF